MSTPSTTTHIAAGEKFPIVQQSLDGYQRQQLKRDLGSGVVNMTIPAPLVRDVQRGAHLSLAAACEGLAEQATLMASGSATQAKPQMTAEYRVAVADVDAVRAFLGLVGWDESTTLPADPSRLDAKPGGYHDTSVWAATHFEVLHDALTRVVEDLDGEDASESGAYASLVELLQMLESWIEGAREMTDTPSGPSTMEVTAPATAKAAA